MVINTSKFIYKVLSENEAVEAEVGAELYPIAAIVANDTTFPYIVYQRDSVTPTYAKGGLVGAECRCVVYVCNDNYDGSVALAEKVITAMSDHTETFADEGEIYYCRWTGAQETYQEDTYVQELSFDININKL